MKKRPNEGSQITMKKKQRSEVEKFEDQTKLFRDLKRRRAEVEEKLNSYKQLEQKMSTRVKEIGKQLAEGSLAGRRLQSRKRTFDEFVRLLPTVRESLAEAKLESETCVSLIEEMESAIAPTSNLSNSDFAAEDSGLVVPRMMIEHQKS